MQCQIDSSSRLHYPPVAEGSLPLYNSMVGPKAGEAGPEDPLKLAT